MYSNCLNSEMKNSAISSLFDILLFKKKKKEAFFGHFTLNIRPGPIHNSPVMFLQPHSQSGLCFVFKARHACFVMPVLVRGAIFSIYCC